MDRPFIADIARSAFALLVVCAMLFASRIMISKVALDGGALPLQVAFIANAGAGLFLYGMVRRLGVAIPAERTHLVLYLFLGFVSVGVPNALQQFVVLNVGPAYTSTVFALSPALTLAIAAGIGLERLVLRRVIGIALGLCGMLALMQQQIAQLDFDRSIWVVLGLGIPLCAAIGNVVRSAYWPKGSSALAFSFATISTSACFLFVLTLAFEKQSAAALLAPEVALPLALLMAATAVSYVMNFRLQEVGGSVFFSQLGYWGTGFGVLFAALLFGDVLTPWSLLALAAIIGGGLLVRGKAAPGRAALPGMAGR